MMSVQHRRIGSGLACAAALLVGTSAWAGGFQVNEHAAAATGRASAVTATIDDPSAIFHNAAGLTQTKGTEFVAGLSLIRPRGAYEGVGVPSANPSGEVVRQETVQKFVPVPYAYVSRALSQKAFVGFGFYSPYGLGVRWDDRDNGSSFVGRTVVEQITLRTFFLTPAIALKLSDVVSVAVSVSLVPANVYLRRTLGAADNGQVLFPADRYGREGQVEISGSAFGVGANAGIQLSLIDHLRIGFNFRSAVDLTFTGKAHFTLPENAPAEIRSRFPDGDGDADLTLPHAFALGVGWVDGPLTVEVSSQLTLWESYDELRINFASGLPTPSTSSPRDWKASPLFRLGGQYILDDIAIRAGLAYDLTPVPDETIDPTLPDNDRFIFSLGGGYDFGVVRADLGYMGLIVASRDSNSSVNFPAGRYPGGLVHVISLSAGLEL